MADTINASDQEMIDQILAIRAINHAIDTDPKPVKLRGYANPQGATTGTYHQLLAGNNVGDSGNPTFNAGAVQNAFLNLAKSVDGRLADVETNLRNCMTGIVEAGNLMDNADLQAQMAAQHF